MEGVLESIHDLPAVIDREAFVRDGWAGDVAAKAFEGVALMGSAARAGMEGESRELSDAGVGRRRVGRDGAQGQGLAPGVGAGGDAVVDGGAEHCARSSTPPILKPRPIPRRRKTKIDLANHILHIDGVAGGALIGRPGSARD